MEELKAKFDGTSQWPINDWITCLAKGGGPKKGFNITWTLTLPSTSCISEQFRDIQEVISLILHCKTMYCCQRKKPPKGQAVRVFHCSEPDGRRSKHGRNSMRLGQAKDRTVQMYLETSSIYSVLVQFRPRSEERIAILSNTITCNRSLQHTTCELHRKRYAWRLSRSYTIKYTNLQGCSSYPEAEFAMWATGSTWAKSKKILWPPKRSGKLRRNPQRQRWL